MKTRHALLPVGLMLAATFLIGAGPERQSPSLFNTPEINARGRALTEAATIQLQDARKALASGNLNETEIVLGGMVTAEAGSAGWHRGMAAQIVHLATTSTSQEGRSSRLALLKRAELHLLEAIRKAKTPRLQAAAQVVLGALYERHLAYPDKAREAYEAAERLAPDFLPATESAQRLRRTQAYFEKLRSAKAQ